MMKTLIETQKKAVFFTHIEIIILIILIQEVSLTVLRHFIELIFLDKENVLRGQGFSLVKKAGYQLSGDT